MNTALIRFTASMWRRKSSCTWKNPSLYLIIIYLIIKRRQANEESKQIASLNLDFLICRKDDNSNNDQVSPRLV